uniref:3-oxoacyl-[acyl-carrier-protein] reductase n=1 Tax=Caenorhabditis japonica TaxID=281687 RepID=A0A8R1DYM0_CAEJA
MDNTSINSLFFLQNLLAAWNGADNKNKSKSNKNKTKKEKKKEHQKEQTALKEQVSAEEDSDKENIVQETAQVKQTAPLLEKNGPAQPVKEQEPVQQQKVLQESPKENQKRKPVKTVNVRDLDQKKVLARLSTVSDLEDGYIAFLTTAFRDADLQKNNLSLEVKALHKKLTDANQKVEKLNKDKASVAEREKQEQNKQANLTAKLQALQSRESELQKAVDVAQANLQTREEALGKENQQLHAKIEKIDGEMNALRGNNQNLASEVKGLQQKLAAAPKPSENAASQAEIVKLNEQIRKFEQVVRENEAHLEKKTGDYLALSQEAAELEKANKELEDNLASSRRELVLQTEREAKKNQAIRELEEKLAATTVEKNNAVESHDQIKSLVVELNKDVGQFHSYKDEQEAIVASLKQREVTREQEIASEKARFHEKEAALEKELSVEKEKRSVAETALEQEKSRIVEIPSNSAAPEPVVEEVFELKKTNTDLAAAPSTSGPSELEEQLKAENAKLQEKNDELRQRNYTLLEKTDNSSSGNVLDERRRVVAVVGKLGKKQLKAVDDEKAFFTYLDDTVSGVQKELSQKKTAAAPAPAPVALATSGSATANTSAQNEECYRQALVAVLFADTLTTPFRISQAALPQLSKSKNGSIVFLTSCFGFTPSIDMGLFSVASNSVLSLTKAVASSAAKKGVRVNSVVSGMVEGDGTGAVWDNASGEEARQIRQQLESMIPLGRLGRPADVASYVEFLASSKARYITGQSEHSPNFP